MNPNTHSHGGHVLKTVLSTLQLWGIAVGLVISGEYFGWSYGWASAGLRNFGGLLGKAEDEGRIHGGHEDRGDGEAGRV